MQAERSLKPAPRQVVVLRRDDWARWLDPDAVQEPLLQPPPAGHLEVEQVA